MRTVRLFVASPDDVERERRRVERVVERLNGEFAGVLRIEAICSQAAFQFHSGDTDFEDVPTPADCDIVLAIFWSELGSELPPDCPTMPSGEPYPSVTACELLTAIEARADAGFPDVAVLRKTERLRVPIDDAAELERAQLEWRRLQSFLDRSISAEQSSNGVTLRNFATTDDLQREVEALLRAWIETHGLVGRSVAGRSVTWPIATKGSPFCALAPFDAEHAPVFFGRAQEIAHAVDRLKAAAERKTPFLLIVGAGGVGKSSLVHAGVVPRLTAPGVIADVDAWRLALLRPGARPLDALAEIRTLDRADEDEGAARAALLLVVDPLDDLFAADVAAADRAAFAAALRQLVASERVWVVATLRAALYEAFLAQSDLKALKDDGAGFDLAAPDAAALAEIVRKPAQAAGLVFETDAAGTPLDAVLLRDAAGADALPALQFTLQRLFVERHLIGQERRLTFAAYAAMGGVAGAIEQTAEAALAELDDAERQALPPLLRRLVVRADVPLVDAAPDAATRRLVEALVGARIVVLTTERGSPAIRLAHSHAIERWPRAREIVASKPELTGARSARRTSTRRWAPAAMATAALVLLGVLAGWQFLVARSAQQAERAAIIARDRALEQRQLADTQRQAADEQSRIAQQRESTAEAQRVAAQRQEQAAADELAIARRRQEQAEQARQAADDRRDQALSAQSRVLADLAERKRQEGDAVAAALLAMEALPDASSGIVRPLVREAQLSLERAWRAPPGERPREVSLLSGHADAVRACALSRDGARAVTGGADTAVRVWDARSGAPLAALQGHADAVTFVAFSADGSRIVTAAEDGVRVWDAGARAQIALLAEKRSLIAVSDDGRGVISVAAANRLMLWDAGTGQETSKTLGPVLATRFGADGPRVLAAGGDNSIELYDAGSGRRLRVFRGHWRKPLNAVFSPDGQRIASIGEDQTARIWNVADGRALFLLSDAKLGRDTTIQSTADRALVPFDAGWRIYALDGARRLADIAGNDGKAARALFSASGKFVVSFAEGSAPKLWDGTTGKELAAVVQPGPASCAAISQDERQLLIGAGNGVAELWSFDADADRPSADTLEALLAFSKAHAPRCLTAEQRAQAFLELQPPAWCIELAKWPYDTPAWKDWLRFKRENAAPPLPNSSEWRPWVANWLASRSASEGQTTRPAEHDLSSK